MKPVKDSTLDVLEDAVPDAVKAIRAYLAYQGENPQYAQKAKAAIAIPSALAKLRSSETNRMQVELIAERINNESPRQLRAAK